MTTNIGQPSGNDPRFPRQPPRQAAPGEAARAAAEARILRCGRGVNKCGTAIPVGSLTPDQRRQYALDLGFQAGQTPETAHLLYCGKLCREMDQIPVLPPECRKPGCSRGCVCKSQSNAVGTPVPCKITRVTVRDNVDRQGRAHRAVVCDRWACDSAHYVDPIMTAERIARFAEDSGFVQTAHGTVCGPSCAKLLAADVAAGRQDAVVELSQVPGQTKDTKSLVEAPVSKEEHRVVPAQAGRPVREAGIAPMPRPTRVSVRKTG